MYSLVLQRNRIFLFALALPAFGGSIQGIKNFHQVDQHLYRGAQPNDEGFASLAKIGVKTIIDLREPGERSQYEQSAVTAAGMKYINVPMTGLTPPSDSEITKILGILEDGSSGPVFVHCMRGADRTGAVIAAYRIEHDGWANNRALSEAKAMGMSFFQLPRKSFIQGFQPRAVLAREKASAASGSSPGAEVVDSDAPVTRP